MAKQKNNSTYFTLLFTNFYKIVVDICPVKVYNEYTKRQDLKRLCQVIAYLVK